MNGDVWHFTYWPINRRRWRVYVQFVALPGDRRLVRGGRWRGIIRSYLRRP